LEYLKPTILTELVHRTASPVTRFQANQVIEESQQYYLHSERGLKIMVIIARKSNVHVKNVKH